MNTPTDNQTASAPETRKANCNHCKRQIIKVDGIWIDPEATGDDEIWREVCDSHDTFDAIHEPKRTIPAEKPTAQFNSWLWPNKTIGKHASGYLREEHNALVNAHAKAQAQAAQLAEALRRLVASPDVNADMLSPETIKAADVAREALAAYEAAQ